MNILRVIVDEVPENCDVCELSGYDGTNMITRQACIVQWGRQIQAVYTRPDWCPLESEDE